MDFLQAMADLKTQRLAACRFEQEGQGKFRDRITLCRNGRVLFERFNYGEAAGLVCAMWGRVADDDSIKWEYDSCDYSGKTDAPQKLDLYDGQALWFEKKQLAWQPVGDLKTMPKAGLGWLKMLFAR